MNRETGITVTHEDLQWVLTAITTPLGGLHLIKNCHQRPGRVHLDTVDTVGLATERRVAVTVRQERLGSQGPGGEPPAVDGGQPHPDHLIPIDSSRAAR